MVTSLPLSEGNSPDMIVVVGTNGGQGVVGRFGGCR